MVIAFSFLFTACGPSAKATDPTATQALPTETATLSPTSAATQSEMPTQPNQSLIPSVTATPEVYVFGLIINQVKILFIDPPAPDAEGYETLAQGEFSSDIGLPTITFQFVQDGPIRGYTAGMVVMLGYDRGFGPRLQSIQYVVNDQGVPQDITVTIDGNEINNGTLDEEFSDFSITDSSIEVTINDPNCMLGPILEIDSVNIQLYSCLPPEMPNT